MKKAKTSARVKKIVQAAAIVATILDGKRLYKVLSPTGESQNGGSLCWSLPTEKPGDWHEVPEVSMCNSGLHLTTEPVQWWKPNCRVFEVEAEGFQEDAYNAGKTLWREDKVVAKKVRLIRELSNDELVPLGIIRQGEHKIDGDRRCVVEGSARVSASGSAQVTAYDSAQVTASGSAQVTASDSAQVTASGSAQVTASGSAQVTASGSARVSASGMAIVGTWKGSNYYPNASKVDLAGDATHVDYRAGGRPTIHFAETPAVEPTTEAAQ